MSGNKGQKRDGKNGQDPPQKDYLGRILIGFVVAAAIFWTLTFIF